VNAALLAVRISGATSIVVAVLTYLLAKRKEREADWNKVKLEYYKEYISAVAGMVEGRATPDAHVRYTDAFNTIALVASPAVLAAVRAYQDEVSIKNTARNDLRHDELYSNLVNALRNDLPPRRRHKSMALAFHMITVRPDMRATLEKSK